MKASFERLHNHLQDALDCYEKLGAALDACVATLHQAATEVAAKTAALDMESLEVHRLTGELHGKAKSRPTPLRRRNGPK